MAARVPRTCRSCRVRHVDTPEPQGFADQWISAWNARDVEAVLTLYAEEGLFTSPTAQHVVPESGGTVQGKQALRSYWTQAVEDNRDLHFELVGVYHGVAAIVLHYRNQLAATAGTRASPEVAVKTRRGLGRRSSQGSAAGWLTLLELDQAAGCGLIPADSPCGRSSSKPAPVTAR